MSKEDLILQDYYEKVQQFDLDEKFLRLYETEKTPLREIFSYFHQRLNQLFEFMNHKNGVNKHYNADDSRELHSLIGEYDEFSYLLKNEGKDVLLHEVYKRAMDYWKPRLVLSGGTTIPDDFQPIQTIKYEPILEMPNRSVKITGRRQPYQLQMVGQGAFSVVQKYKDEHYGTYFAIKQARKTLDSRELERFRREFEIMKDLSFPYILDVHSFDEQNNSYTMEYCELTLDEYISKNPNLPFRSRKTVALQFLYGLNYLHSKSILHRDLSYRNVLIKRYDYNSAIVKLSDFGLVKEYSSEFTKSDSEIKGTIVDPCLDKFKDYNVQNELYAIGVILLFIFTGRKNLKPNSDSIYKVLERCIDNNIDNRYKDVNEVIADIDSMVEKGQ